MKPSPRRRIPSTDSLVIFEAAARLCSFTRAGEALHLTQSAVSRQVIELERFLDEPMFVRTGRQLELTAAGADYLATIRPLLQQIEVATDQMRQRKHLQQALNLTVAASFCNLWLMPRLSAFLALHPGVIVNVRSWVGPLQMAGRFDAAVINASMPPTGLQSCRLFPIRVQAFGSPRWCDGTRAAPDAERLASLPLLHLQESPEAWDHYLAAMGRPDLKAARGPCNAMFLLNCEAALAGQGLALLPPELAAAHVAAGRLVPMAPQCLTSDRSYYLVWDALREASPALQALRAWMGAEVGLPAGAAASEPGEG
ncbi:MAG: LysR family transcriptional regulator [Curvibacter sp.]|nr:LysR family transcriptional regulator [Curvibacter sp.]